MSAGRGLRPAHNRNCPEIGALTACPYGKRLGGRMSLFYRIISLFAAGVPPKKPDSFMSALPPKADIVHGGGNVRFLVLIVVSFVNVD
jgi:hypothetical protein